MNRLDEIKGHAFITERDQRHVDWLVGIVEQMIPMIVWVANFSVHPTAIEEARTLLLEL